MDFRYSFFHAFVAATLNVQLNYDKDVVDKIQIKELFGLGFSYNVF